MQAIILAAGRGQRLAPLTDDRPKCLVPFRGRPLIDHVLGALRAAGIDDIAIVTGYHAEVLQDHLAGQNLTFFHNPSWAKTNMLFSFLTTRAWWSDDILLSYSDIVYNPLIIRQVCEYPADIRIPIDLDWQKLWRLRMPDPLADAETLLLNQTNQILEIGGKPANYDMIQGQYMGLIGMQKSFLPKFSEYLDKLTDEGWDLSQAHMTGLLNRLTKELTPVQALPIKGGWLEIDTHADLAAYTNYESAGHDLLQLQCG